jgi:choline dehydrogenase-like flavoprotein
MVAAGACQVIVPNMAEDWHLHLAPDDSAEQRQQKLDALVATMQATGVRKYDMPLFSAHQMGSCRMGTSRRWGGWRRHWPALWSRPAVAAASAAAAAAAADRPLARGCRALHVVRRTSSCDAHGEVWDVSGLYVADGSTFPTPSGVNPMISIYGISHQTAKGIAQRWKARRVANGVAASRHAAQAGKAATRL